MSRRHWFLPDDPDVIGLLRDQAAVTVEAMDALVAWAGGDALAVERLRTLEQRGDDCKRKVRAALGTAFMTPLDPEDLFELSRDLDRVLDDAKNAVREAELMRAAPDAAMGEMSRAITDGVRELDRALAHLAAGDHHAATGAADRAARSHSDVEHIYRAAMSALVGVGDVREVAAKRELYRRLARMSDRMSDVAERVWYSVLKER